MTCEEITKYLEDKELDGLDYVGDVEGYIYVRVDGDWHHTHAYLDYLMQRLGFTCLYEMNVVEDGSDWYESTHIFKQK